MNNFNKFIHSKRAYGHKVVKAAKQSWLKIYTSKVNQTSITGNVSD